MATRLIMIRHGQSEDNVSNLIQGRDAGSKLTEKGIRQAKASAERLKNENIDAIYSSPTLRTEQTAKLINKYHDLKIKIEPELKDRDFGVLIGTPSNESEMTEEQKEMHKKRKKDEDYRVPDGESFKDLKKRVKRIIFKILQDHRNKTVVIVSHGNTIRGIVCELLKISIEESYKMKGAINCGYTEIEINGEPKLVSYFCDAHLSDI